MTMSCIPIVVVFFALLGWCSAQNTTTAAAAVPQCSQPMMTGPCRAAHQRFFYNSTTGQCQQFIYGGCRGNANNFNDTTSCMMACGAKIAVSPTSSAPAVPQCQQPAMTGMCRGYMPRFYYNSTTKTCQSFIYGGCGGNNNRFATAVECITACGGVTTVMMPTQTTTKTAAVPQCQQPAIPFMCRAYVPSYYYNSTTRTCQSFIYGGCAGNSNRFPDAASCMAICGGMMMRTTTKPPGYNYTSGWIFGPKVPVNLSCYSCSSGSDPHCTRYGNLQNAQIIKGCRVCVTRSMSVLGISMTKRYCQTDPCVDNAETTCCYTDLCNHPSNQRSWVSDAPPVMSMTSLIVTMATFVLALSVTLKE